MNGWHTVGIVLAGLSVVWLLVRRLDSMRTDVYPSVDRFLDLGLSPTLGVMAIVFLYVGGLPATRAAESTTVSRPRPSIRTSAEEPSPSKGPGPPTTESRLPSPTRSIVLRFRVIDQAKRAPIPGVDAAVNNVTATSDTSGVLTIAASSRLSDDAIVRFSHGDYVRRFERLGNIAEGSAIAMRPKMRVLAIATTTDGPSADGAADGQLLLNQFEAGFLRDGVEQLPNERDRKRIVEQLYKFSEGRALYDPKTLQHVGEFHGATHGVFLTTRSGREQKAMARLVDFKTSQVTQIVEMPIGGEGASNAGHLLAEQLLAEIAELEILTPIDDIVCGRQVTLQGSSRFLPEGWNMWISVQPVGNPWHFPQLPVSLLKDGRWIASDVSLGEAVQKQPKQAFNVYVLLTNPERSIAIKHYLEGASNGHNTGTNLNLWDKRSYKLLGSITISRDSAVNECRKS